MMDCSRVFARFSRGWWRCAKVIARNTFNRRNQELEKQLSEARSTISQMESSNAASSSHLQTITAELESAKITLDKAVSTQGSQREQPVSQKDNKAKLENDLKSATSASSVPCAPSEQSAISALSEIARAYRNDVKNSTDSSQHELADATSDNAKDFQILDFKKKLEAKATQVEELRRQLQVLEKWSTTCDANADLNASSIHGAVSSSSVCSTAAPSVAATTPSEPGSSAEDVREKLKQTELKLNKEIALRKTYQAELIFLKKLDKRLAAVAQDAKDLALQKKQRDEQPFSLISLTNLFKPAPELAANTPILDEGPVVFDDDYLFAVLGASATPSPPASPRAHPLIMTHFIGDLADEGDVKSLKVSSTLV